MDTFETDEKLKNLTRKIDSKINSGEYYEANQISRTLQFRCMNQNQFKHAILLTYYGAHKLLLHKQYKSGLDLSKLLLEILFKYNETCSEIKYDLLKNIIILMDHSDDETAEFVSRCVKLTSTNDNQNGDPYFHKILANIYLEINEDHLANVHMIYSKDGLFGSSFLLKLINKYEDTFNYDLVIFQAILQSLCIKGNVQSAELMFRDFTKSHPQIKKDFPFKEPLLNFCHFLLNTLREKDHNCFKTINQLYKPCISRDGYLFEYLNKIEELYFSSQNSRPTNIFSVIENFINSSSELNDLTNSNTLIDNTELD